MIERTQSPKKDTAPPRVAQQKRAILGPIVCIESLALDLPNLANRLLVIENPTWGN